ncbi:3-deoxy-manno-octulosonate cytidylyltransferase [Arcobacter sp. LA11]|uniref:3-deoxy-manno-octulosonate cytidylyltransferase n=1 Tax=Arcobacter sp. LA11 TaxID=1898176 RepID=UPI0009F8BD5C|nr:3-deoxy-manno-octulosonate cytidylyltransferase [Arcobacter sp. LA11]
MKLNIRILDCTLRDGGYINNWNFENLHIKKIIDSLEESNVDIIECGYLDEQKGKDKNSSLFDSINTVDSLLSNTNTHSKKVLMINFSDYSIDKLPKKNSNFITGIRLAFHKKDLTEALKLGKEIIDNGYELYFQPMITKNYNDLDFLVMLKEVNILNPYAFYIVDSFGSMSLKEFTRYVNLTDNNLNEKISLGYHSHNNMQLAFSNAISLCMSSLNRDVIIDSSIYGIGRGAGNLNTELIFDFMNKTFNRDYKTLPLLEVIDDFLNSLMHKNSWGFSPAQFLSASFNCHPNYSKYLINKNTKHIAEINQILSQIPEHKKSNFEQEYIEELYLNTIVNNSSKLEQKDLEFDKSKKILLIASGTSVKEYSSIIEEKVKSNDYLTVSLNHKSDFDTDFYFFTNQKRLDEFKNKIDLEKTIISNNLNITSDIVPFILDINLIAKLEGKVFTNVALIAINSFFQKGISEIEIAGLDGYSINSENYNYNETTQILDKQALENENEILLDGLKSLNEKISIQLITPSIFKSHFKLNIIGVIPARFKSSRYEGKPLALINGIPMIKRTYEQAKKSKLLDELIVATEHEKIKNYCESENIPVIMTSDNCLTGTDRIAEVTKEKHFDLYVNIQGDEPVIDPLSIDEVVSEYKKYKDEYVAYNLYKVIDDESEVNADTIIKTIVNEKDELMYMSRLGVPFNKSDKKVNHKKQVCVYGFTKKALDLFSSRDKTLNEQYEDIEILRFVDMGEKVKMKETRVDSIAVDIPDDVKKVEKFLEENGLI